MFKLTILLLLVAAAVAYPSHHGGDSGHHHEVDHKHGTSHQSVHIHHYHSVPVYVKDDHLLKHPVDIGGTKLGLKILHPETEKSHGHGLVLENHHESHHNEHGHGHGHH